MTPHQESLDRLQWIFDTPNEFAAVCLLILLCLGSCLAASARKSLGLVYVSTAGCLAYVIGCSYSRAAYLAMAVCLPLYVTLLPRGRRASGVLFLLVCILGISLAPAISQRLDQTGLRDLSITHRLSVWRSTLQLISQHPIGVGRAAFFETFNTFYKDASLHATYVTPVNTYLAVAAWWGLPMLAVVLFLQALLCFQALACSLIAKTPMAGGIAALHVSFFIAAFSSPFVGSLLPLAAYMAIAIFSTVLLMLADKGYIHRIPRNSLFASLFGLSLTLVIFTAGTLINRTDRMPTVTVHSLENTKIRDVHISALKSPSRSLLVIVAEDEFGAEVWQELLRPLACNGFDTRILIEPDTFSQTELSEAVQASECICGITSTVSMTITLSSMAPKLDRILVCNTDASPLPELAGQKFTKQNPGKTLILMADDKKSSFAENTANRIVQPDILYYKPVDGFLPFTEIAQLVLEWKRAHCIN